MHIAQWSSPVPVDTPTAPEAGMSPTPHLSPYYLNPFSDRTTISCLLGPEAHVRLTIHDVSGWMAPVVVDG